MSNPTFTVCTRDNPKVPTSKQDIVKHPDFIVVGPPKEDWEYGEVWETRECIHCKTKFDFKIQ